MQILLKKSLMTFGPVRVIILTHSYFRGAGKSSSPFQAAWEEQWLLFQWQKWKDALGTRLPRYIVTFGFLGSELEMGRMGLGFIYSSTYLSNMY
jgi:hypothetical protein